MPRYKIHTDHRTSKYRRAHVIMNETESIMVWYPTITECLAWLLDRGETTVHMVDETGEFKIEFNVHEKQG